MSDLTSPGTVERRVLRDRRARRTTLPSLFRPKGRRKGFRRRGERLNSYVDCPSPQASTLVLSIVFLSVLDALFTLLHLQQGGHEVNPVMAMMLVLGIPAFLLAKGLLTNAGVIFLAIHENFRMGRIALQVTAALYSALLVYHSVLYLQAAR